jgi:hypothetical protein
MAIKEPKSSVKFLLPCYRVRESVGFERMRLVEDQTGARKSGFWDVLCTTLMPSDRYAGMFAQYSIGG